MGFYHDLILPRLIHVACSNKHIAVCRAELLRQAAGTVLEIGFGSGTNLIHFQSSVEKLLVVEPCKTALDMAKKAILAAPFPVEIVGDDGQKIPLPDASVDTVVITFTLCTIPDIDATLAEAARVLRSGCSLLFLEHGLSHEDWAACWQNRLNRLQMRLCGGCQLNRRIDEAIKRAPLNLCELKTFYLPRAPKTHGFIYQGRAEKP